MAAAERSAGSAGPAVLEASDLRKVFSARRGRSILRAVDGLDFSIGRGETLALVGESGCGKTTTGKLVMRLLAPTAGSIRLDGEDATVLGRKADFAYRRRVQMIFQDPYASMNPHFRVRDILEEPLLIHGIGRSRGERMELAAEALEKVRMSPVSDYLDRHPHMLSGGQRQRVAIARTLVLKPSIIVADEPVSMIDLSTRAEILQLMKSIQAEAGISYLYITHDISTARFFADRIAVMYLGRIVETGSQDEVIDRPIHPYTRALIGAVCEPTAGRSRMLRELEIRGELPSAADIPSGCRFRTRCLRATADCAVPPEPELAEISPGHLQACRRWKEP